MIKPAFRLELKWNISFDKQANQHYLMVMYQIMMITRHDPYLSSA